MCTLQFIGMMMMGAGGSEEVSHMDEKGIGVNVSFGRTGTIRGGVRQMGQLTKKRSHTGRGII